MDGLVQNAVTAGGFSMGTAYFLARASWSAYETQSDAVEMLGSRGETAFFSCGQFGGLVSFQHDATVLAFRGTQNVENILTDTDTLFVSEFPYPGRVHCGFAGAVREVWTEVRRILGGPGRSKPLLLTGHSLGGAMATLASIRLASEGYAVHAVYTFGSPRVGDRFFRASYRLPNYRFVNENDLVPHLPFRWCYKHVGTLRLIDSDGQFTEERAAWVGKKRKLAPKAKHVHRTHRNGGILHEVLDFDWLTDHYLDRYLSAIRKLLRRTSDERRVPLFGENQGISLMPLRPHSAAIEAPHGFPTRSRRRTPNLSEADLVAAFGKQPQSAFRTRPSEQRRSA